MGTNLYYPPEKIKILYVINRLEVGGASVVAADIASSIDLDRFDFTIVAGSAKIPDYESISKIQAAGVEVIDNAITPPSTRGLRFGGVRVSLIAAIGAWRLFCIIRRKKPDIVHSNTILVGWVVPFVAWLAGTRIVVHTPHNPPYFAESNHLKNLIFRALERFSTRFIHTTVALSVYEEKIRKDLGVFGTQGIVVIPDAVDSSLFQRVGKKEVMDLKHEWGIPADMKLVTAVGRLERQKDPWTLIEAARRMIQDMGMSSVIFLIVGDGSLRVKLETYVKENNVLRDRVLFLFTRPRKEVVKILSMSDAFVLASLYEGFGIVVIEAMAIGVPVVVTDAVPNLVQDGETGFVVRKRNPQAMAEKLFTILNNPFLARRMGERSRVIAQQYSISKFVKRHERLYLNLFKSL
ncbi:MAG: glycosyltransferase [Planctomycetota bacterium]